MQHQTHGTTNYQILTDSRTFWEYEFSKAKLIFDNFKKKKQSVKLIIEYWEGEIGGDGVHSEHIIFE